MLNKKQQLLNVLASYENRGKVYCKNCKEIVNTKKGKLNKKKFCRICNEEEKNLISLNKLI